MSTLLIDTDGGSKFTNGSDVGGEAGKKLMELFGIKQAIKLTDTDPKPELKPRTGVIDVVRDFSWYAGPKSTDVALNKVPCVFLEEREQLVSSLATGAAYYLNAASRAMSDAMQSDSAGQLLSMLGADQKDIGERISLSNQDDLELLKNHNLKSLEGIYFTKKTGFNYRIPLYDQPSAQSSTWGFETNSLAQGIVEGGQEVISNITEIANLGQPGVYIEKPRYFTTATEGRSETLSFPLANTIRRGIHSPVQQNYELLWLLAFQNKPYKTSFGRTPPPKIYTVSVPGQFSMPYAYISNLKVEHVGTKRNTKVWVPSGQGEAGKAIGKTQINTPIPEAYTVSITFTSLLGSYGNEMLSNAFNTLIDGNRVTIGKIG